MGRRHILAAMILAGVVGLPGGLGAPGPASARTAACPHHSPVTVRDLIALAGKRYDAWGANPRGHACFGSRTIRIRAFANWPDGIGGISMSGVKPVEFEWPSLYLFASSREVSPGYGGGPFYGVVVPPRFGKVERTFHRRWVDVTARFGDPYAGRCRGWAAEGRPLSRAKAIAQCRDTLVLVSIAPARTLPDSAAAANGAPPARRPAPPLGWLLAAGVAAAGLSFRRTGGRHAGRR